MTGSKPVALPLGYAPICGRGRSFQVWQISAKASRLLPQCRNIATHFRGCNAYLRRSPKNLYEGIWEGFSKARNGRKDPAIKFKQFCNSTIYGLRSDIRISGCNALWVCVVFGMRRLQVQILPSRPITTNIGANRAGDIVNAPK